MVNITVTNESYLGANDGRVNITPLFGVAPYTYLWSNGSTFKDIVGLSPDMYSCVITDSEENQVTIEATVSEGLPELIVTLNITPPQCPAGTGRVTATSTGGNDSYVYVWSNSNGIIGGSYDGSFDESFPTVLPNVALFQEGYYSVQITSGTQIEVINFYVPAPLNYIFYYEVISPAETPLGTATVYYKFANVKGVSITNGDISIADSGVDGIIESTLELPVGTTKLTGTWTPIGSEDNSCSMSIQFEITSDYTCNLFQVVAFDLNVTAQTLYVSFEGEVGQMYYRFNKDSWIPFSAPSTITNLPFGINEIYFRNEAGCVILKRIKAYQLLDFEQSDKITISYSSNKSKWVSLHSYSPNTIVQVNDRVIALNEVDTSKQIHEHNLGDTGDYYGEVFRSIIDFVFKAPEGVIWSFFQWNNIVTERNGVYLYDETIDYVTVRNLLQTSGQIELEKKYNITRYQEEYYDASLLKNSWHFNKFRDRANVNQSIIRNVYQHYDTIESNLYPPDIVEHELHRMYSDYIILRLEESNERKLKFKINDVVANVIKHYR